MGICLARTCEDEEDVWFLDTIGLHSSCTTDAGSRNGSAKQKHHLTTASWPRGSRHLVANDRQFTQTHGCATLAGGDGPRRAL